MIYYLFSDSCTDRYRSVEIFLKVKTAHPISKVGKNFPMEGRDGCHSFRGEALKKIWAWGQGD